MRFRVCLLRSFDEMIYQTMITDPDIIFCKPPDDPLWQKYFKNYEVITPGTEEKVMGGYYRIIQMA